MDESATNAHADADRRFGSDSEILGRFLDTLGQAHDKSVAVSWYCERYPDLAEKIRELVEMEQMLAGNQAAPDGEGTTTAPPWLGPYHVRRLIGRGGMGEVFEAVEEPLNLSTSAWPASRPVSRRMDHSGAWPSQDFCP
jgi:hypothetical protein